MRYCQVQGEHQPDSKEVHFPARSTQQEIYAAMLSSFSHLVDDLPTFSTFYEVWKREFPHMIVPKAIQLGKCPVCEQYDIAVTAASSASQKMQYHTLRNKHISLMKAERIALDNFIQVSFSYPADVHYVCTDYMTPMRMPHFAELPKPFYVKSRPKMNVFGLVDWTYPSRSYTTHWDLWQPTCNVHISLLFHHLWFIRSSGKHSTRLVLNTDNAAKDNKNVTMFAFVSMLISLGWYTSVEYHLLMPGHSHYCVDRDCFSKIGKKKQRKNCMTEDDFWTTFLPSCFSETSLPGTLLKLIAIYDWKAYFLPHLVAVHGHSSARSFKFARSTNTNLISMWYKTSILNAQWIGGDDGLPIMRYFPDSLDLPSIIPPVPLDDQLFVDLPDYLEYCSPVQQSWWRAHRVSQFQEGQYCQQLEDFWLQGVEFPIVQNILAPFERSRVAKISVQNLNILPCLSHAIIGYWIIVLNYSMECQISLGPIVEIDLSEGLLYFELHHMDGEKRWVNTGTLGCSVLPEVLVYGFTLTLANKLRHNTEKQLKQSLSNLNK
jgi:hypothetical protein